MKYLRRFKQHSEYNDPNIFDPTITYCSKENEVHFKSDEYDYSKDYLTFESLEDNNIFFFSGTDADYFQTIQVSTDNGTIWTEKTSSLEGTELFTLNKGDKAIIKSTTWHRNAKDNYNLNTFKSYKKYIVYGNIMSLLYGDNFENQTSLNSITKTFLGLFYLSGRLKSISNLIFPFTTCVADCCYYMFRGCSIIEEPPKLPATTAASGCYMRMFQECINLKSCPNLLATTTALQCYSYMFSGCTNLVNVPSILPALTLSGANCYSYMFEGCTNLRTVPELPATTLTSYCYYCMFLNCINLNMTPNLQALNLSDRCYAGMFKGCSNLLYAAELSALYLPLECYANMFLDCVNLITPPSRLGIRHGLDCCSYMFQGCTSLTYGPELPAVNLATRSYRAMFKNCTSLVLAPELPAQTLAFNCYYEMFLNCTNLNYVKARFTTDPGTNLTNWLANVSSTGTFLKNPNAEWELSGPNGVPEGWTIQNIPVENTHTEVEYLLSTGTQAIDTGIYLDSTMSFGIRFRPINNVNLWILLAGWRVNGSNNQCLINYYTTNGQVCTDRLSSGYIGSPTNSINVGEWQNVECIVEGNNVSLYLNDLLLDTKTNQSFTSTLKAYLFGANVNGTIDNRSLIVDISNFWIKDSNGNYLINLIPVRKDAIGYMYDQVTHQLFSNIGTGAFNYGEDIN